MGPLDVVIYKLVGWCLGLTALCLVPALVDAWIQKKINAENRKRGRSKWRDWRDYR